MEKTKVKVTMEIEELKQEAEDYAEKHAFRVPYDGSNKFYDDVDFNASKEGYLAGAEPREKQIAELEAQIEKMKNWCNCKNYSQCLIELAEQGKGMKPSECCVNCKKWELEDYKTRLERRNKKKQEIKEND
jgi:hypothetical protein